MKRQTKPMKRFKLEKSEKDVITSNSGLALVGLCLNKFTSLCRLADEHLPCQEIPTSDILKTYMGILSTGKNDFEAAADKRGDEFFIDALDIKCVPSPETTRQRLDSLGPTFRSAVANASVELIKQAKAPVTALENGYMPLDVDVVTMDNSNTKKEGVSFTYQKYDGYAPISAYLGLEGWSLDMELRPGSQHSQKDFVPFLHRVLYRARTIVGSEQPLLARLDSAHDAKESMAALIDADNVDFIIKWNPRGQNQQNWWKRAVEEGAPTVHPHVPGLRAATLEEAISFEYEDKTYKCRRIVKVAERTIDRNGQKLLFPKYEIEGWWTSMDSSSKEIIKLYKDHGTSEQFHSEFKSDLGIERLPSGKFATNALILSMAALAYNMLRLIGQIGLLGEISPVRHPAQRRRVRTVLQEIIYLAARVIKTGRRKILRFGAHCPGFEAFQIVYRRLATA